MKTEKIHESVILPGSYDPVTNGHLEIIKRAAALYDKVIVLSAVNASKNYLLCEKSRLTLIEDAIKDIPNAVAESFSGLLADYCAAHGNPVIVKGLRNEKDFVYEQEMAILNKDLGLRRHNINIETVFMCADAQFAEISSTMVRLYASTGTSYDDLVPNPSLLRELLGK